MIVRKTNKIPVRQDGAGDTPPVPGVETCVRVGRQEYADRPAPGQPRAAHGERTHGLDDRMPLGDFTDASVRGRAREGIDCPSLNSHNAFGRHRPVNPKLSDELGEYLRNQPRLVVVGLNFDCLPDMGDFAVPMMFFPFNHNQEIARG